MKKFIIIILIGIIIGTIIGVKIGIHAPKWVEEHPGYYVVCTEFLGNVYEDVADKEHEHVNNAHVYAISWR